MPDYNEELLSYASAGNLVGVQNCLMKNADINTRTRRRETALMLAAEQGHFAIVTELLQHKEININLNTGEPNHRTALSSAINKGHAQIINVLVERNELAQRDIDIALMYYAKQGNLSGVNVCLARGADINANFLGRTTLLNALENDHKDIETLLLSKTELDINATNHRRENALHLALDKNDNELAKELLSRGKIYLHQQSYLFSTPLTLAVFSKNIELARLLLEKEKIFNNKDHPEALNWAVRNGLLELVELMINKGADVNQLSSLGAIEVPDWVWKTEVPSWAWEMSMEGDDCYPISPFCGHDLPLNWAVRKENAALVECLLSHGADPYLKNGRGESALTLCDETASVEIKEHLAQHCAAEALRNKWAKFHSERAMTVSASDHLDQDSSLNFQLEKLCTSMIEVLKNADENNRDVLKTQVITKLNQVFSEIAMPNATPKPS